MAVLFLSITMVSAAIKTNQTKAASSENNIPTGASFVLMWLFVVFLAIIEGGQGALVGLLPIDKSKYQKSHPWAYVGDRAKREE